MEIVVLLLSDTYSSDDAVPGHLAYFINVIWRLVTYKSFTLHCNQVQSWGCKSPISVVRMQRKLPNYSRQHCVSFGCLSFECHLPKLLSPLPGKRQLMHQRVRKDFTPLFTIAVLPTRDVLLNNENNNSHDPTLLLDAVKLQRRRAPEWQKIHSSVPLIGGSLMTVFTKKKSSTNFVMWVNLPLSCCS